MGFLHYIYVPIIKNDDDYSGVVNVKSHFKNKGVFVNDPGAQVLVGGSFSNYENSAFCNKGIVNNVKSDINISCNSVYHNSGMTLGGVVKSAGLVKQGIIPIVVKDYSNICSKNTINVSYSTDRDDRLEGKKLSFDIVFTDSNPSNTKWNVKANFGDKKSDSKTVTKKSVTIKHKYSDNERYETSVSVSPVNDKKLVASDGTVIYKGGSSDKATKKIRIKNVDPTVSFSGKVCPESAIKVKEYSIDEILSKDLKNPNWRDDVKSKCSKGVDKILPEAEENTPFTLNGKISDKGWKDRFSDQIVNWGDDTEDPLNTEGAKRKEPKATQEFEQTHTFLQEGKYTIKVCTKDDDYKERAIYEYRDLDGIVLDKDQYKKELRQQEKDNEKLVEELEDTIEDEIDELKKLKEEAKESEDETLENEIRDKIDAKRFQKEYAELYVSDKESFLKLEKLDQEINELEKLKKEAEKSDDDTAKKEFEDKLDAKEDEFKDLEDIFDDDDFLKIENQVKAGKITKTQIGVKPTTGFGCNTEVLTVHSDDRDLDGILNAEDNCPLIENADQTNFDADEMGDVCDIDDDNDTIPDELDFEPFNPDNMTFGNDVTSIRVISGLENMAYGIDSDNKLKIFTKGPVEIKVCDFAPVSLPKKTKVNISCDFTIDVIDAHNKRPVNVSLEEYGGPVLLLGERTNISIDESLEITNLSSRKAEIKLSEVDIISGSDKIKIPGNNSVTLNPDVDGDGILNNIDNCIKDENIDQANFDADELGDVCDADDDNDGIADTIDFEPNNSENKTFGNDFASGMIISGLPIISEEDSKIIVKGNKGAQIQACDVLFSIDKGEIGISCYDEQTLEVSSDSKRVKLVVNGEQVKISRDKSQLFGKAVEELEAAEAKTKEDKKLVKEKAKELKKQKKDQEKNLKKQYESDKKQLKENYGSDNKQLKEKYNSDKEESKNNKKQLKENYESEKKQLKEKYNSDKEESESDKKQLKEKYNSDKKQLKEKYESEKMKPREKYNSDKKQLKENYESDKKQLKEEYNSDKKQLKDSETSEKEFSFGGTLESEQTFAVMNSDESTGTYGKQGYSYGFRAIGVGHTEINSDKICGLSLCSEKMSTADILQQYLQSKGLD